MQALLDAVNASLLTMRVKGKATIKGELELLEAAGVIAHCAEVEYELDTSTKAAFISSLDTLATHLVNGEHVMALDALKVEIAETITQAGATSFKLGRLLIEAREACENQEEFLEWTDSNFGIKKAWAFKLMAVSKKFEGEPWASVATSVLYTLQAQANEEQLLEAKKFAEAGKLDAKTLKALLAPPVVHVAPQAKETSASQQKAAESVQAALMEASPVDSNIPLSKPEAPVAAVSVPMIQQQPTAKADTLDLKQQNEELLRMVADLTKQIAELTKPRINSGPTMPMLAQFNSPCLYARLGLSQEDAADKGKILEAFKALCKAGYGRQHEAFQLIDEARHQLIHANVEVAA